MDMLTLDSMDEAGRIIGGLNFMKFVKGTWSPEAWYFLYHTERDNGVPVSVLKRRNGTGEFRYTLFPGHQTLDALTAHLN